MLSVANAFEISDFQEDGIEVTRTRRLECNNVICLLSPGCAGDGQVGREFGRPGPSCAMMRRLGLNKPNGYLLGSYRIATAPEPNSSRLTSLKSTRFDSPANNVGPWPA